MQVKPQDLSSHLEGGLASLYLVSGDETLIVEESCDAIIARARADGFTERSVHHVESGFHWHELAQDGASMSLFAERRIIDVRLAANKFDKEAVAALAEWTENPPDDTLLLLRTGRLQPRQRSAKWFKSLDKAGVVMLIWPVDARELPRWLGARMRERGLQAERDALELLAERVEGNLLAAAQEVDKLALLSLPQPIDANVLLSVLEDTSRFSSFDLIDAVMAGDGARVSRVIAGLREEGANLFAVLGAFTSQLRRGGNTRGLPPQRQRLVKGFLSRVGDIPAVLSECAVIDRQGKGQGLADAWISLERLLLRLSGLRSLTLPSRDDRILVRPPQNV